MNWERDVKLRDMALRAVRQKRGAPVTEIYGNLVGVLPQSISLFDAFKFIGAIYFEHWNEQLASIGVPGTMLGQLVASLPPGSNRASEFRQIGVILPAEVPPAVEVQSTTAATKVTIPPGYVSIVEAATTIEVSAHTVGDWVRDGRIPTINPFKDVAKGTIGAKRYVLLEDVKRYCEKRKQARAQQGDQGNFYKTTEDAALDDDPKYIKMSAAVLETGVERTTLGEWCSDGLVQAVRGRANNRAWYIDRESLRQFVEARKEATKSIEADLEQATLPFEAAPAGDLAGMVEANVQATLQLAERIGEFARAFVRMQQQLEEFMAPPKEASPDANV